MKSLASRNFWKCYAALPSEARRNADRCYALWRNSPSHPSLHFKPIIRGLWSVRVGLDYRAMGKFLDGSTFLWIWIGTHAEYDQLIS